MTDFVEDVTTVSGTDFVEKVDDGGGGGGGGAVDSVFGRTGTVTAQTGDYTAAQVAAAPDSATFLTQTPSSGLSGEQAMSALATGIVKNTTATGVQSIASQGVDYYAPGGTDVAIADGGTGASVAATALSNLGGVAKSLYDANTVLAANSDDTPAALTMGASTVLARLAAGNIKAATIQEILALYEGTSMPGSPATNDRFFRTDLGLECYYDGTRWLTTNLFTLPWTSATQMPFTVTTAIGYGTPETTYDMWLVNWTTSSLVSTTNNGTNFWTIALEKRDSANAATTIDSFTTAADTANVVALRTRSLGVALGGSSTYKLLNTLATKTLSPGGLYAPVTLRYRLIVT